MNNKKGVSPFYYLRKVLMAYIHQIRKIDFENSFQEPGYRLPTQSNIPVGAVVAVFFNFCSFHCTDCWNSETWERDDTLYVDNEFAASEIVKALTARKTNPPMGLSLLGGDPILPENILDTCDILRRVLDELPDLVVGVWSGYTWAAIERERVKDTPEGRALDWVVHHIDVVIDGQFNRLRKVDNRRYGSTNQRVINVPKTLDTGKVIQTDSYLAEAKENAERIDILKNARLRAKIL